MSIQRKIVSFYRNLKRGWKWFKRGYKCPDYDWHYLLNVMNWKMKDMREYFDKCEYVDLRHQPRNGQFVDLLTGLDECISLTDRLIEDDYAYEIPEVDQWRMQCAVTAELFQMPKELRDKLRDAIDREEQDRELDLDKLFTYMNKHIREWAD